MRGPLQAVRVAARSRCRSSGVMPTDEGTRGRPRLTIKLKARHRGLLLEMSRIGKIGNEETGRSRPGVGFEEARPGVVAARRGVNWGHFARRSFLTGTRACRSLPDDEDQAGNRIGGIENREFLGTPGPDEAGDLVDINRATVGALEVGEAAASQVAGFVRSPGPICGFFSSCGRKLTPTLGAPRSGASVVLPRRGAGHQHTNN